MTAISTSKSPAPLSPRTKARPTRSYRRKVLTITAGGVFRLKVFVPDGYPVTPPKVRFLTKIYHPNIDDKGRICLDSLAEQWSSVWHISTILLSIQALLSAPNPSDPLDPEIGKKWRENEALAIKTAAAWTRLYATPAGQAEGEETTQAQENTSPTQNNTTQTEIEQEPPGLSVKVWSKGPMAVALPTEIDQFPPGFFAKVRPKVPVIRKEHSQDIFKYASLGRADETRILRLHPGLPSDPLAGTIQHVVLPSYSRGNDSQHVADPETPAYEALSYTWGEAKVTYGIYLHSYDSEPGKQALDLTENCAFALRRLRLPDKERLLWVDAICINQADVAERSAQVRIMHRIYKTASRVLIYLGEGSVATDRAITILEDDANGQRQCVTDKLHRYEETNLLLFFSLPWFKRVWVLQEVAWATTALVFCGSRSVPWETLHKAYTSSIGRLERLQPMPHVLSFGEPRPDQLMTPKELLEELQNARICDASDPRDRVYALLELFHRRPSDPRLAIDYERELIDLYTDVAEYLLENLGLDILGEHNISNLGLIPNWATNWAAPPRMTYRFGGCFAGGHDLVFRPQFVLEPPTFIPPKPDLSLGRQILNELNPWAPDWRWTGDGKPRRAVKVRAAHLHTVGTSPRSFDFPIAPVTGQPVSTIWTEWDSPENVPAFEQLMQHIRNVESGALHSDRFDINSPAPPDMTDFRRRWSPEMKRTKQMLLKLRDRQIFTTESGFPAIGPCHARHGGTIVALQGASMCHVLQPRRRAGVFTYVGDCFLYGHMQLSRRGAATRYNVGDDEGEEVAWEEILIM
ncbi:hypothetical protein B0T18DRAFT_400674 [Schizothecium vesticola]|uniref:UBC core domain-containing protein n=1 Tax=Schizothecium vesticola TaxID=314040 RepID=A0AA40FC68_9PEZI|nr:hypothetical protein B0T18DRAFT_400674 [Schizothecium vesticola]